MITLRDRLSIYTESVFCLLPCACESTETFDDFLFFGCLLSFGAFIHIIWLS